MTFQNLTIPYPDFKLQEVIDPEQFDLNNKSFQDSINQMIALINRLTDNNKLGESGAEAIRSASIAGLAGGNVYDLLKNIYANLVTVQTLANDNASNLTVHQGSGDHDARYYTKLELDGRLRGGDTVIKIEPFTIVNANLGNGTFTYKDTANTVYTGTISAAGNQVFTLRLGVYQNNLNRITAQINDTTVKSAASGGLIESTDGVSVEVVGQQVANTEITFTYFERIGLMGEHKLTHQAGGNDMITVSEPMLDSGLSAKVNGGSRSDSTKPFVVEVRNSDPSAPVIGQMWLRSDL